MLGVEGGISAFLHFCISAFPQPASILSITHAPLGSPLAGAPRVPQSSSCRPTNLWMMAKGSKLGPRCPQLTTKPYCPTCRSGDVFFRSRTNDYRCRRCGATTPKGKIVLSRGKWRFCPIESGPRAERPTRLLGLQKTKLYSVTHLFVWSPQGWGQGQEP